MPDDQKIGGAYVQVGARTDELEQMLGRSETLTKQSLKAMGDMASEFARNFSSAMGLAVPGASAGAVATALGEGAATVGGSRVGLMGAAGGVGADPKAMQAIAAQMYSQFREKMAISPADANAIMETGLRSTAISPDGSNAGDFFKMVRTMSMVGNVSATQAAQDAAASKMGGADLSRYQFYSPGGPLMNQFGLFQGFMQKRAFEGDVIAQDPREIAARRYKDVVGAFGAGGDMLMSLLAPAVKGMGNLDTDAEGNVFGAGSHLRMNFDQTSPGGASPQGNAVDSLLNAVRNLTIKIDNWVNEHRTANQGT